ncbi:MAG: hypothetical protein HY924_04935 [Elusimicrobia bacterium]|nr:hypothetical protein [Elusimicrobiota bacterium]
MTRPSGGGAALTALLAWAALLAGLGYWNSSFDGPGPVLAVTVSEVEALRERSGGSSRELWGRLRALGVTAALLPEERLSDLAADGRVLGCSRAECEKWVAMGLAAPGAEMRPGTLWIRDGAVLLRVAAAARASGAAFSTSSAGGFHFIEFPESFDWAGLALGMAPDAAKALSGAGLVPVQDSAGGTVVAAGRRMKRVDLPAGLSGAALLRAVRSGPDPFVVWTPAPGGDVEAGLASLRESVKTSRRGGPPLGVVEAAAEAGRRSGPDAGWEWPAKLAFGLIVLAGPLLAVRVGLAALHGVRPLVRHAAPLGSPVLECAAGLAACWGAAALAGLAARLAALAAGPSLGGVWRVWALAAPMVLGAVSLFPPPWPGLARLWHAPLTPASLLKACILGLAAFLCLDAAAEPAASAVAGLLRAAAPSAGGAAWWVPDRWREIVVGWPCLLAALAAMSRNRQRTGEECADGPAAAAPDPRVLLLAAILAPASQVLVGSNPGVAWGAGLWYSLAGLGLGAGVGALLRPALLDLRCLFR